MVAKLGQDGHDRGAKVIASVFGDLRFEVADIAAAADAVRATGARILSDGTPKIGAHGKPVLFAHPMDFHGALVEFEQA